VLFLSSVLITILLIFASRFFQNFPSVYDTNAAISSRRRIFVGLHNLLLLFCTFYCTENSFKIL